MERSRNVNSRSKCQSSTPPCLPTRQVRLTNLNFHTASTNERAGRNQIDSGKVYFLPLLTFLRYFIKGSK